MEGVVTKKLANSFFVKNGEDVYVCMPRGKMKECGVFVGDKVQFCEKEKVIESVNKRKNLLIRPPIANIDIMLIVVSPIPKPDFCIVDKLILFCKCYDITPCIVVNKQDVDKSVNEYVESVYSKFYKTFFVSAKSGENVANLKQFLRGKISAFSGQSAVGKSALTNAIFEKEIMQEGELSKKINRGKNTTRHTEIFCENDIMLADTSGFTALDEKLLPISYFELPYYYDDFIVHSNKCKYTSCVHISESVGDCEIKKLVKENKIDRQRYERYKQIYEILKQKWVRTHG